VTRCIAQGDYNCVSLSPVIFLDSNLWNQIYFSDKFQQRLGLVVVDEAHMVCEWGIREKTHEKNSQFLRYG
jgi:superfamily II DNA helicase RecQ